MRKYLKGRNLILVLFLVWGPALFSQNNSENYISNAIKGMVTVRFNETDSLFPNPGQGWMSSRFPSTIKYVRMGWADFEPERGKYDWSKIDNAIASARLKVLPASHCSVPSRSYLIINKLSFPFNISGGRENEPKLTEDE